MESIVRVLDQTPSFAIMVLARWISGVVDKRRLDNVDFKRRTSLNTTVANDDDRKVIWQS